MSSSSASSRGSTPPPHNLLPAPTIDDGSGPVSAERFLAIHSNKLFLQINKEEERYQPSLEILREEVKRRSESNKQDGNKPKPNGWSAKKCTDWLKANPITGEADVAFLFKRAKEIKKVVANATQKKSSSDAAEQGNKCFKDIIAETSKDATLAADRRHAEDKETPKSGCHLRHQHNNQTQLWIDLKIPLRVAVDHHDYPGRQDSDLPQTGLQKAHRCSTRNNHEIGIHLANY
ncbi:hypothetical protein IV203_027153 [Nitzschia inconspicua]|uniref:Uncharacterized protein n=1 Tax=Nitzschia inconspicua TaxID=303405 RepID=A0A9K3PXT8_9STRA|nr:hypothetical protein IV203_027153 [Nitzschia inconspicua]